MMSIDLNCDLGEGFGVYTLGDDEEIMPLISSANIACGFHASDPVLMEKTVRSAKMHGVAIGAHPSYPDRVGFGRRAMDVGLEAMRADIVYQVGALAAFCRLGGVPISHVKLHGALYNRAAQEPDTARAVAETVRSAVPDAYLVCLAGSALAEAARECSMPYLEEAFADRAYNADGTLVPRTRKGALLTDPESIAERAVRMVLDQRVESVDGIPVPLSFQTLCVHGDTPSALAVLRAIGRCLASAGICIRAPGKKRG